MHDGQRADSPATLFSSRVRSPRASMEARREAIFGTYPPQKIHERLDLDLSAGGDEGDRASRRAGQLEWLSTGAGTREPEDTKCRIGCWSIKTHGNKK